MPHIDVTEKDSEKGTFFVTVSEGATKTSHTVCLTDAVHKQFSQGRVTKEEFVRSCFQFLLDREPKESIISSFEIPLIGRYFSDFEKKIPSYFPS